MADLTVLDWFLMTLVAVAACLLVILCFGDFDDDNEGENK